MNVRLMLIGLPAGLVIAGLTACGSSIGERGSGSGSPQLPYPPLSSPAAQGRPLTGSATGPVSTDGATAPAVAGPPASADPGDPTSPPAVVITRVVSVPAPAASSAPTSTKSSPAPSSTPSSTASSTATSTAVAAPPGELTGPTWMHATALTAPACTSRSGDVDVQVSWTSTNADGVWTMTQSDNLVINDPRTDGGRHVARFGNTEFLFDCSVDTEYYIFRAYNATNYETFLLLVSNNLP
jgi:hypothetical protein